MSHLNGRKSSQTKNRKKWPIAIFDIEKTKDLHQVFTASLILIGESDSQTENREKHCRLDFYDIKKRRDVTPPLHNAIDFP